jgi:predicted nucleic acid-binding protein
VEVRRLLLDTSAYSAYGNGHREAGYAIDEADEIYINTVVLGELYVGFMGGKNRERNRAEFDRFVASPRINIVEIDEVTAERYALIYETLRAVGTPISANDLWIAASALQHGLEILTFDRDFTRVPQVITRLLS